MKSPDRQGPNGHLRKKGRGPVEECLKRKSDLPGRPLHSLDLHFPIYIFIKPSKATILYFSLQLIGKKNLFNPWDLQ